MARAGGDIDRCGEVGDLAGCCGEVGGLARCCKRGGRWEIVEHTFEDVALLLESVGCGEQLVRVGQEVRAVFGGRFEAKGFKE